MTERGTRANPNFINCNPLNIMQKLYEIKTRQDGSNMKVIVREITPEEVRVVDFKFGAESPAHRRQVQRYVSLYKAMGYPSVRGWLWYIREEGEDKIVEV